MSLTATPSLEGLRTHGLPMTSADPPSSGFTAVNSDRQTATSFRASEIGKRPANNKDHAQVSHSENVLSAVNFHPHGWRADSHASYTPQLESPESKKRKRSNSSETELGRDDHSDRPTTYAVGSPVRRAMQIDSAIDLSSPAGNTQASVTFLTERQAHDRLPLGVYSRYVFAGSVRLGRG